MMSVHTTTDGHVISRVAGYADGHRSPLSVRWGGWYVTGTTLHDFHLGNMLPSDLFPVNEKKSFSGISLTSLKRKIDTSRYPMPTSDIVALMVMEHQVRMQNLIAAFTQTSQEIISSTHAGERATLSALTNSDGFNYALSSLLEYMLFRDEYELKGTVRGTSDFAKKFSNLGPRDHFGRSLRDFDLHRHIFRYPCSYLVYASGLRKAPGIATTLLWRRLGNILQGVDRSPPWDTMGSAEKKAVFEILMDTNQSFANVIRADQISGNDRLGKKFDVTDETSGPYDRTDLRPIAIKNPESNSNLARR